MRNIREDSLAAMCRATIAFLSAGMLLLTGCVESMPSLPALIQFGAAASDVQGTWTGSYVCAQGPTAVRLRLQATGAQSVQGVFEFSSLPGQSNAPTGSFAVAGSVAMGNLNLAPGAWIERPANYTPVHVVAGIFDAPQRMVGHIPDSGCGRFEVVRTSPSPAIDASVRATGAPVATHVPSAEVPAGTVATPAFTGEWIGRISCGDAATNIHLLVYRSVNGRTDAIGDLSGRKGKLVHFGMFGQQRGDQLQLRWDRDSATLNPGRIAPIDIDANWRSDPQRIVGHVVNRRCKAFELERRTVGSTASVSAATRNAAASESLAHTRSVQQPGIDDAPGQAKGAGASKSEKRGGTNAVPKCQLIEALVKVKERRVLPGGGLYLSLVDAKTGKQVVKGDMDADSAKRYGGYQRGATFCYQLNDDD